MYCSMDHIFMIILVHKTTDIQPDVSTERINNATLGKNFNERFSYAQAERDSSYVVSE